MSAVFYETAKTPHLTSEEDVLLMVKRITMHAGCNHNQ